MAFLSAYCKKCSDRKKGASALMTENSPPSIETDTLRDAAARSLFRLETEYERGELCVKEKNVPHVVAGCVRDRMRKKQ